MSIIPIKFNGKIKNKYIPLAVLLYLYIISNI